MIRMERWPITIGYGTSLAEAEQALIEMTYKYCHENKRNTCLLLGCSMRTLHAKLKQYRQKREAVAGTSTLV